MRDGMEVVSIKMAGLLIDTYNKNVDSVVANNLEHLIGRACVKRLLLMVVFVTQ